MPVKSEVGKHTRWRDLSSMPVPEPLIESVLDRAALCMLAGPSSSMKTFIALSWSASIASGHSWFGHKVPVQGRVEYMMGEGLGSVYPRLLAWEAHTEATVPDSELIVRDAVVLMTPDVFHMNPVGSEWSGWLDFIRASRPCLVVVDTLSMAIAGEEETTFATMSAVTSLCRRAMAAVPGTSVLLVHHFGKDKSRGSSGHHSLHDQMDQVFYTEFGKTEDQVTVYGAKNRNGAKMPPHRLALVPSESSVVLVNREPALV